MTSPLMEYLGIAGLDIAWLFIGIFVVLLILLILHCTVCKVQKAEEKVRQIYERQRRKEPGKGYYRSV